MARAYRTGVERATLEIVTMRAAEKRITRAATRID